MSSTYSTEPVTSGKVLLKTSVGDVDIELWSKEAPRACRNFVTLVLSGAYDNTLFDRILHGFIVQHEGNPAEPATGAPPLKDELHQRIRFNHRGQVAMVKDSRSKFFITLGPAEHLRCTIFGKVAGPTIFNVLRLGAVPTDDRDCPQYPVKLISAEVLSNPFDDIVPENIKKVAQGQQQDLEKKDGTGTANEVRRKRKSVRNSGLLSFSMYGAGASNDEDEEEEEDDDGEEDDRQEEKDEAGHISTSNGLIKDKSRKNGAPVQLKIRLKSSHDNHRNDGGGKYSSVNSGSANRRKKRKIGTEPSAHSQDEQLSPARQEAPNNPNQIEDDREREEAAIISPSSADKASTDLSKLSRFTSGVNVILYDDDDGEDEDY